MKREILLVPGVAAPPGPFSHVVRANGLLFLTSQLACDLDTNRLLSGDIGEQTRLALENVKRLLEGSGSSLDRVVRVAVYLRDLDDFDAMNEVYRRYFPAGSEPARVALQASSPLQDIDVEIEITALAE
jgi:2-iminobutanoate/2-iminopropanoate deaminase